MRMGIKTDLREWSLFKADREASYIKIQMGHEHRNLAMVSLRNPDAGDWAALPPNALLFGAVEASLRYNCFSRLRSVLFNRIFGFPLIGYCVEDFVELFPSKLAPIAVMTFGRFSESLAFDSRWPKPNAQAPSCSSP